MDKTLDFQPMWDYCLLDPIINNTTAGGVVLPDNMKQDEVGKSVVVAAGRGTYKDNGMFVDNPVRVGDIVYHMSRMAPYKVRLGGKLYLCLAARDIVAIVPRDQ